MNTPADQGSFTSEGASGSGLGPVEPPDLSTGGAAGGVGGAVPLHGVGLGATQMPSEGAGTREGDSTPEIRIPGKKFTCGGCTAQWTGLRQAHCAGCHRTFTTAGNFDRHRTPGICHNPSVRGLLQRPDGLWSMPAADPTQREMTWRTR